MRLDQLLVWCLRGGFRWGLVGLILSYVIAWVDAGLFAPTWNSRATPSTSTASPAQTFTFHSLNGLPWSSTANGEVISYQYESFGLPFPAAIVIYKSGLASDRSWMKWQKLALGIPIGGFRAPGNQVARALPLVPWWGLAPNIIIWAGAAYTCRAWWLLLRARARKARRRCPSCGYPMDRTTLCPECGSARLRDDA